MSDAAKVEELLRSTGGRIFTVVFQKRTTGEMRVMNARLGVQKHLKGGTQAYDPAERKLLTVFDMQKKGYRMIDLNSVQEVHFEDKVIKF